MEKSLCILFICLALTSCKDTETEYFANGTLAKEYHLKNGKFDGIYKDYYENGKPKSIYIFKEGIKVDSSLFYNDKNDFIEKINYYLLGDTIKTKFLYSNGNVASTGLFFNGQKISHWKYFNKNGVLEKIFEYKNINGKQYTNRGWMFDNKGDTIKDAGSYYILNTIPKSIKYGDTLNLNFKYKPFFARNTNVVMYLSSKINSDFSNLSSVRLDTLSLNDNEAIIKMSFKNKGKRNIRGLIKEFTTTPDKITKSKSTYFDIPILVK